MTFFGVARIANIRGSRNLSWGRPMRNAMRIAGLLMAVLATGCRTSNAVGRFFGRVMDSTVDNAIDSAAVTAAEYQSDHKWNADEKRIWTATHNQ